MKINLRNSINKIRDPDPIENTIKSGYSQKSRAENNTTFTNEVNKLRK